MTRGHLGEFGRVVPQGAANVRRLVAVVADEHSDLPEAARASLQVLTATLAQLDGQIETMDAEIDRRAKENEVARRLMGSARPGLKSSPGGFAAGADRPELPGIGPLIATALATLAPPREMFRQGRDLAASCRRHASGVTLGLAPRQHSTGGKQRRRAGGTPRA